jgi:hypothetical protein
LESCWEIGGSGGFTVSRTQAKIISGGIKFTKISKIYSGFSKHNFVEVRMDHREI